jgi:D-serine deaminase-like pyridoxal phosphate-dependent protein
MNLSWIGKHKNELDTPALLIDIDKLKDNIQKMAAFGIAQGVHIRPHCKTHKCSKIALLQQDAGAIGISAAKLSEAEVLIKNGIRSVLLTSPVVSIAKFSRLLSCLQNSDELILVLDSFENAEALNTLALQNQLQIKVLVDIDGGIGRTGVSFDRALEFGQYIGQLKGLAVLGIQCYAGHLQHISNFADRKYQSLSVMKKASNMRQMFVDAGLNAAILTGTGTGTYDIDVEAQVTEIQPGSYVAMDVEYANIGSKCHEQHFLDFSHAMTLMTSVLSHNQKEHVTVDAGTKSIYVDAFHTPHIISHPHLEYHWGGFGDEHGKVYGLGVEHLKLGETLEMVVPHCDPTINLYDQFFVIEQDRVIDIWEIDMRGCAQ